jgi:glycosyltransferase involved in cell wall biosynthesis
MMSQIHVMHITYDMRIGGTEMVIKNIIDGLTQDPKQSTTKFKMSVLCIESPLGPFSEELQNNGIEFFEFNRKPGFDTNLIKQIRHTIKNNHVDIIHCHQYTPWVYGTIAAAFTRTKVIFTEHGRFHPDSSSWKRKISNPFLLMLTDRVTAISKATKKALTEFEFIPKTKIEVIYNGIKPLVSNNEKVHILREKYKIPKNANVLGTIARLDPIKNQTIMIRSLKKLLTTLPNTYLIIVGDGEEREKLEKLVDELDVRPHVFFTGYITQPVDYLEVMDVFLLSSLSEGTSMTLLEAMSLSKPCVVTDAGGNAEIILHEESGFVTQNNDSEMFSQAIDKLLSIKNEVNRLGNLANNRFIKNFTAHQMNRNYSKLYDDVLHNKNVTPREKIND